MQVVVQIATAKGSNNFRFAQFQKALPRRRARTCKSGRGQEYGRHRRPLRRSQLPPENAGPAGRPATSGTKAQGRPRWNVLSGKLERLSGQGQGTGGEDALKSLKSSPTSGPGLCLPGSRKGTAAAVRNSKASPAVQPPPPAAGPHLSLSNVKRYLRLLVPETKFSECQLQSQYILHSEDQEGGTEGRVDAGKQKQMTECVSQRQQHPLCYLMYLLPDGAGSPLFPSLEPGPTS